MAEQLLTLKDKKAKKFFSTLIENAKDVTGKKKEYTSSLSAPVFRDIIDHFEKQTGPKGSWRRWSDAHARHQAKRGRTKKLQDTGRLRQSFFPTNVRSSSEGIIFFNKVPYARIHDEGSEELGPIKHPGTSNGFGRGIKIPPYTVNMPARPYMWLSKKGIDNVGKVTVGFLVRNL